MKQRFKTLSIQKKMFISMLLCCIFAIFFILTASCVVFYNYLFHMEMTSSSKQLNYVSQQLEYFVSSVDNYSKTIISSPVIQDTAHNYNKKLNFNANEAGNVRYELEHIIQNTSYIHSVSLYTSDQHFIYSTENWSTPLSSETLEKIPGPTWLSTKKYSKLSNSVLVETFSYVIPFYSYSTGELLGYVEIAILESSITDIYRNQTTSENNIFIINSSKQIVSATDDDQIGISYSPLTDSNLFKGFSYQFTDEYVTFTMYFPKLDWYLINKMETSIFLHPFYVALLICIGIGACCILLCTYAAHKLAKSITSPIHKLMKHTRTIKDGDWIPIKEGIMDQEMQLLFQNFNSMILAQDQLKDELVQAQEEKDRMTLNLLQEQINPHFLYNTLDNICSLAELDEKETLIQLVMNLSSFYRDTLNSGNTLISLHRELLLTKAYLEILQVRYYDKFTFSIECPENLYDIECLKLLLQPIVENSIYHGIKNMDKKGSIKITVTEEKESIRILVIDNGIGITEDTIYHLWNDDHKKFGVKNIHRRIQLYYGMGYGLTISPGTNGGCQVEIKIGKRRLID